MNIKATVEIINSRRDYAGNCYWGFIYTRTKDGKSVSGYISGDSSNIRQALYYLHQGRHDYTTTVQELGIRNFERWKKTTRYAGCPGKAIADYIKQQLAQ